MKICDEIEQKISLYIDGELDNDSMKEFEQHIGSCTECKEKYQDIKFSLELCKDIEEVNPPIELKTLIFERINRNNNTLGSLNKIFKAQKYIKYISLAAVACLCLAVILTGTLTPPRQKTSQSQLSLADRSAGNNGDSGAANYAMKGKSEKSESEMRSFSDESSKQEAATKPIEPQFTQNIANSSDVNIAYSTDINSNVSIIVYVSNIENELNNIKSIISQDPVKTSFSENLNTTTAANGNDSNSLNFELPKSKIDKLIEDLNDKYSGNVEIIKNDEEDTQAELSVIINLKIK